MVEALFNYSKSPYMNIKAIITIFILSLVVYGCGVNQNDYDRIKEELTDCKKMHSQDSIRIEQLRDTIKMLSYPAQQRIQTINKLVTEGEYEKAKDEVSMLCLLFPESQEAKQTPAIIQKIDKLVEKQQKEEERKKALGFKGLKVLTSETIGYNKVSFSSISVGNTFVFDSYDDRYHYRKADRGNTYVTAVMSVTSSSNDPDLPTLAVYSIDGDKMNRKAIMEVQFARWESYGTYLGNYSDYGNDFAKTSTIKFKLGVEVSSEVIQKPYAIVLMKKNELHRHYDRFGNPPVSYYGSTSYPYSLSLDDFNGADSKYVIVKIANL